MKRNVLHFLNDRLNLREIPFSERGSRLLSFQSDRHLPFRLAKCWFKKEGQLTAYRRRTLDLISSRDDITNIMILSALKIPRPLHPCSAGLRRFSSTWPSRRPGKNHDD